MYGTDGGPIINAGIPAAAITITATGAWDLAAGAAMAVAGVIGILLALRARTQRDRTFGS